MYQGTYTISRNFAGGYCGNLPITGLSLSQASDLDNIVIRPGGNGWRSRQGNTDIVGSINSGASIGSLGFYYLSPTLEYIVLTSGTKFMYRGNNAGSFTDGTGALTVSGQSFHNFFNFNGKLIGIGANDVPFEWDTGGVAVVLTGTPPSALGGFTNNNRVFAYNTIANPNTIYWSVLGNENDWTSAGSGNAVVTAISDQSRGIIAHAVMNTNYVLLFTNTTTYQMVTTTAPFPIYSFLTDTGCTGQQAVVNIDGMIYWISQRKRMLATDGTTIKTFPSNADDLWNSVLDGQTAKIVGWRQKAKDYDWIVWSVCTSGTANNRSIIWDLHNNCWLRNTTGYSATCVTQPAGPTTTATLPRGTIVMGTTAGKIYQQDVANKFSDDSNSSTAITNYWQSGWLNPAVLDKIVHVNRMNLVAGAQTNGQFVVTYGYDFATSFSTFNISLVPSASELYILRGSELVGIGNNVLFKITNNDSYGGSLYEINMRGKTFGQKVLRP